MLRDLRECEVYILDYSGEVEVSNCSGCKLFFGAPGLSHGALHSAHAFYNNMLHSSRRYVCRAPACSHTLQYAPTSCVMIASQYFGTSLWSHLVQPDP